MGVFPYTQLTNFVRSLKVGDIAVMSASNDDLGLTIAKMLRNSGKTVNFCVYVEAVTLGIFPLAETNRQQSVSNLLNSLITVENNQKLCKDGETY